MIAERALQIAGPGSLLACRPHGVTHVVPPTPLTPSGRFLPASARPVCRARTRRLSVVTTPERWSSLAGGIPRLCTRCSTRLAHQRALPRAGGLPAGRAEQPPLRTRDDYRAAFGHLDLADLWAAAWAAETADELGVVGHVSLLVHGYQACTEPTVLPDGRQVEPLEDALAYRRGELTGDNWAALQHAEHSDTARRIRKQRNTDIAAVKEAARHIPRTTLAQHLSGAPLS